MVPDSYDAYGEPLFAAKEAVKFSLVRYDMKAEDSTVRADSSATRGNIKEYKASGRALFPATEKLRIGDILIIDGRVFEAKEVEPRYHVLGHLDHYEVDFMKCEDRFGDE